MNERQQLRKELRKVGAKPSEVDQLSAIAGNLKLLKPKPARHFDFARPVWYAGAAVAALVVVAVLSQSASPANWLYPVQKVSDDAVIEVNPAYRETVMMRRAHQVNQLVTSHASQSKIIATLADYTKQASRYKDSSHANYSAFEYCEYNLKQAMVIASPSVRQAITRSLYSVETT